MVRLRSIVTFKIGLRFWLMVRLKLRLRQMFQLMYLDRFNGKVNGHARVVARLEKSRGRFKVHGQQEGNV